MIKSIHSYLGYSRNHLPPSNSLRTRLVKGFVWAAIGSVISQGLRLVTAIVVARILGKMEFGELGMIQSTVAMLGIFTGLGLGLTANKHIAEFREKDPAKAGRILVFSEVLAFSCGFVMVFFLFILSPIIAEKVIAAPHLTPYLRLGAGILFFNVLAGIQIGALSGFEAFKSIARVNLWSGLLHVPIVIIGVYFFGIRGVIYSLGVSSFINWLFSYKALRAQCFKTKVPFILSNFWIELPILWRFSFPALLSGVMVTPILWIANTILVNQPNGYAEMGILNATRQWRQALLFLPTVLGQVVLPMLSSLISKKRQESTRKLMLVSMFAAGIATLPITLVLILASNQIMGLFGPDFSNSGTVLAIVLIATTLIAIQRPIGQVIVASGRMWIGVMMNMGWAIVLLSCTWIFVNKGFGAMGLAISHLIAYGAHGIWTFGFAIRLSSKIKRTSFPLQSTHNTN